LVANIKYAPLPPPPPQTSDTADEFTVARRKMKKLRDLPAFGNWLSAR